MSKNAGFGFPTVRALLAARQKKEKMPQAKQQI
jgi:hypothetical protein